MSGIAGTSLATALYLTPPSHQPHWDWNRKMSRHGGTHLWSRYWLERLLKIQSGQRLWAPKAATCSFPTHCPAAETTNKLPLNKGLRSHQIVQMLFINWKDKCLKTHGSASMSLQESNNWRYGRCEKESNFWPPRSRAQVCQLLPSGTVLDDKEIITNPKDESCPMWHLVPFSCSPCSDPTLFVCNAGDETRTLPC